MKIKTIRIIDYWIGIPLCFLLSVVSRFLIFFSFSKKHGVIPRKILFIKLSELGAIVLAYPLLKKIKEENPRSELFFATFAKNRDIFKILNNIIPDENVITIRDDSLFEFGLDALKAISRLRGEKIDFAFDLDFFSRFTAIFSYMAGSKKRAGLYNYTFEGLYRGNLLTHRIQHNPLIHISKVYLSFGQVIRKGCKITPEMGEALDGNEIDIPKYISKDHIRKNMIERLGNKGIDISQRIYLINPGEGTVPLREWPLENFINLCEKILENPRNSIIVIGTHDAEQKGRVLIAKIRNPRCVSLIGETTLEELMELFNLSSCLISNDCGLAHLAAVSSIDIFVLFGPESPQIFNPPGKNTHAFYSNWPCSPCLSVFNHRDSACAENKCLKAITLADVYDELSKYAESYAAGAAHLGIL